MFHRAAIAFVAGMWLSLILPSARVSADTIPGQFILIVELEIDPAQLEPFKAAIKQIGESIVRSEPGCRAFSAVFEKDDPTRVRLFEVYDNAETFKAYLETPQVKTYAEMTQDMIRSHKRIENVPITLNVKGK